MSEFLPQMTPQEQEDMILLDSKYRAVGLLKDTSPQKEYVCFAPYKIAEIKKEGIDIWIEQSFGLHAGFTDLNYADAGGDILENAALVVHASHILMKLEPFSPEELDLLKPNQIIVSSMDMMQISQEYFSILREKKITAFAIDFIEDLNGNNVLHNILSREENKTSIIAALSNFLYPILITLINSSNLRSTIQTNPALFQSLYCYQGAITRKDISEKVGFPCMDFLSFFWN